jgi:TRAP transporter 4TM/12TM fusion protein
VEKRIINWAIVIVGTAFVVYHLVYAQYTLQGEMENKITHLGFALLTIFLATARAMSSKYRYLYLALALVSLAPIIYIRIFTVELQDRDPWAITNLELVLGIVVIILTVEATRARLGMALPTVAILFFAYAFVGPRLGIFNAPVVGPREWVGHLSIALVETGIFGPLLRISATLVFLFMVFAALVEATGAAGFFREVGKIVGRYSRAGPAMAAVVTSSLVGSVSGATAANVAITGSFTIPAMKEAGYRPEQAGAIEAAASTGGPLIPPVMGIAAFLMAGVTGIPYSKIIGVAVLPAMLYMFSCGLYVQFQASKLKLVRKVEAVDYREMLFRSTLFFVPLLIIIVLFMSGKSPMFVSFWAIISILILSLFRKQTRLSLTGLVDAFVHGARAGSEVAVSCAILGMVIGIFSMTGLGLGLPLLLRDFAGENLLLLLILTGVASSILGMGIPASAAYILVAIVMAPALIDLGVPILSAHFFVFFFAIFSFITPPVAVCAIFASRLAGSRFMETAFEAVKVGVAGFLLPFAIVWVPAFVWDFSNPLFSVAGIVATILILVCLQASIVGYGLTKLNVLARLILAIVAFVLFAYLYTTGMAWLVTGIGILIIMFFWQLAQRKRQEYEAKINEVKVG